MSALDRLAAMCGIVPSFKDARGDIQTASADTRRALLAAMGIEAADETAAGTALRALEECDWSRVLPPALVLVQAERLSVPLNLPADSAACTWVLRLEDGSEHRGEAHFGALERIGTYTLAGTELESRRLPLELPVAPGYHRLSVQCSAPDSQGRGHVGETSLIVSPGTCWLPDAIEDGRRLWGVAAQMYLLRSARDWGIGDYGDLERLVGMLAARGADVVGLNPLHALFLDAPEQASPYSPASRLLLNVLNIDVDAVPELGDCAAARELLESEDFQRRLGRARAASLVDYGAVAALKLPLLEQLFAAARADERSPRWGAFIAFRRASGDTFERACVFLALRRHFAARPEGADWHAWPEEFHDPASEAVAAFAGAHAPAIDFQAWLQFVADEQLARAAAAARLMQVGLYRDLAVGADRSGVETWANQAAVVDRAQVGAPPDIYNPAGQDWGLPPFNPRALREEGYRSFIELLRANMRHAGGLRIDHVMALQQLYWVPQGQPPTRGAYVRYPIDDLVGIIALESRRQRCLVVGEDLGTVPDGFRERMSAARILSYRVLFFEKDKTGFRPPESYPTLALAVAGSHDLPTLRGWWEEGDIELKDKLELYPEESDRRAADEERITDRRELLAAFRRANLPSGAEMDVDVLVRTAHAFLARSNSALAVVQMDDITDEASPVNVPATNEEHPNWRRRLGLTLEEIEQSPRLATLTEVFRKERDAPRLRRVGL